MQILVDADACPVKEIIVNLAKRARIPVIMLCDTSHILHDGYSRIITVDKARDSADLAIMNLCRPGDIVITQDYGVAAMALGKGAYCLDQNGMIYDADNMDRLLFERHLGQKSRRIGMHTKGQRKRKKEDDDSFERAFSGLLSKILDQKDL